LRAASSGGGIQHRIVPIVEHIGTNNSEGRDQQRRDISVNRNALSESMR